MSGFVILLGICLLATQVPFITVLNLNICSLGRSLFPLCALICLLSSIQHKPANTVLPRKEGFQCSGSARCTGCPAASLGESRVTLYGSLVSWCLRDGFAGTEKSGDSIWIFKWLFQALYTVPWQVKPFLFWRYVFFNRGTSYRPCVSLKTHRAEDAEWLMLGCELSVCHGIFLSSPTCRREIVSSSYNAV